MSGSFDIARRAFLRVAAAGGLLGLNDAKAKAAPSAEADPPADSSDLTIRRPASDFMVDVLKTLPIDYIASNPGSSFRSLHESLVNYGGNRSPEFLTCCHEESAVAMAHGYYKIAGKPMAVMLHGTVGVQHAAMAIYNAYADRVPIYMLSGNTLDAATRRGGTEWFHSVQDNAAIVRDITKWDDQPWSLQHFAESAVRAYRIAVSQPGGPVLITVDGILQEDALSPEHERALHIPKLSLELPPQGDLAALEALADMLVTAENPVILADRYARNETGLRHLVELAELIQAPVVDLQNRVNFPSPHPLNHSGRRKPLLAQADLILALEPADLWGALHDVRDVAGRPSVSLIRDKVKVASISMAGFSTKANYQDIQRYVETDLSIAGDAETSLPFLIESLRRKIPSSRRDALSVRGRKLAEAHARMIAQSRETAAAGFDLSPISPARLAMELWDQIKDHDWSHVGLAHPWARQLWPMDRHYRHTGHSGASGVGYGAPAAVGSALANRDQGRLSVAIQPDGDLMFGPGILWTAAHHRIPLLMAMFNNRAYHQEVMHIQRMANRHERGIDRARIGTTLDDPPIDFAKMAQSMGVHAEGPISDPKDLRRAIQRAIATVKRGEPALIDVISQPR